MLDLESNVTRKVVVRPANEPEHAVVEGVAEVLDRGLGLLQLDIDLGYMASPRIVQWAAQGVHIIARPWPQGGGRFTKPDFTLDFTHGAVTCPNGQTVPMVPGKDAQCPASACAPCPVRTRCTTARIGQGRSLTIREDEPFQDNLRAKIRTKRGRAALRKRTAVEHALSHHLAHQGRRARDKGLRKNQFDGRRHAAVSNLQVAAHDEEERRLAAQATIELISVLGHLHRSSCALPWERPGWPRSQAKALAQHVLRKCTRADLTRHHFYRTL